MAELNENKNGVFGGVNFEEPHKDMSNSYFGGVNENPTENAGTVGNRPSNSFDTIEKNKAMTKQGLWSRVKAFLFQEIDLTAPVKVELTPYQQKVENEINAFLHQEVTFKGIANFFRGNK